MNTIAIKKIVFNNMETSTNYLAIGGIRFYDEKNTLIPSGSPITETSANGEFDNFIVASSVNGVDGRYFPSYAFDTSKPQFGGGYADNVCYATSVKTGVSLSCVFKEPVKQISRIEYNPTPTINSINRNVWHFKIEVYNELDTIIYSKEVVANTSVNDMVYSIDTPGLGSIQRFLIKSSNKMQTLLDGEWLDTGLNEPLTKADFEEFGMDDLSIVSSEKWNELDEEFEVLTWTDAEDEPQIEIEVPPFRPLDKLDNQFSIVMGEYTPE